MKKIFNSIIALGAASVMLTGCFDLEEHAYSEVVKKDFTPTDQDVVALLSKSYSEFGAFMDWYGIFDCMEEAADVIITPTRPNGWDDGGVYKRMHWHKWTSEDPGSPESLYYYAFSGINSANKVLDQLKDGSLPAGDLTESAIDELKAVRATWYSVLLDSHGNVPIVTKFAMEEGEEIKQSSRKRVYEFVTKQLEEVIANGLVSDKKSDYTRLNMWGVKMALMRTYLNAEVYTGTPAYDKALKLAEDIVNNGPYSLAPDYSDNFKWNVDQTNPEIIFGIPYDEIYPSGERIFSMGMKFYPPSQGRDHFGYANSTWGGNCGNPQFIKSYDPEDKRLNKTWLIGPQMKNDPTNSKSSYTADDVKNQNIAWYCLNYLPSISGDSSDGRSFTHIDFGCRQNKYQVNPAVPKMNHWGNDVSWFRLAEAYYTAAECILRGAASSYGKSAADYVNAVRSRSVATPLTDEDLKSTVSRVQYGLLSYGDINADDIKNYGVFHNWDDNNRAAELIASQVAQPSGRDNDPILLAGMYDEWGYEFALEGLRRQQMIRFGTFSTRNWFNHEADGDDTKAIFPISKSDQMDNENLAQNPGYASENGKYVTDSGILDESPIPANM
ncbi:MAG: RagB/SusD family nutrient uptake outer membrane protein [Bacteroidales bacterium]|nr:RagB/SusD family nutrient uptake outer membrane protein [Bacteroidales bacterium]